MINYLVKTLINKCVPKMEGSRYAEDIISRSKIPLAYSTIAATAYVDDAIVLSVPQEEVIDTQYFECRDLFKENLQQSKLTAEQLIYINNLIDTMLGDKKKYYARKYNNLPHSIYSKLKSSFLDNGNYQEIIQVINLFVL